MSRLLLVLILCCSTVSAWATPGDPVSAGTGRPHLFMENRGQIHTADDQPLPQILYHLAGRGMNVSLTAQSIHYTFIRQRAGKEPAGLNRDAFGALPVPFEYETLGMSVSLIGANPSPMITAEEQQEYYENHYTASARQQGGLTNVRSYARIVYHDVYPLIDWEVYVPQGDGQGGVKYDFIVRPGGNPADVRLKYNGATSLSLLDDGSLLAQTDLGVLREARPYSYIRESGTEIACKYSLQGDILSFSVAKPAAGTLVIDPQVVWITYFGGGGSETCYDVASHQGDAYIGGGTTSISNVATLGSSKTYFSGNNEAYVARFSSAGILLWSTYFGHSGYEIAYTVTLDTNSASPSVFIAGRTDSQDSIATAGAHQAAMNGIVDGFLAKFTAAGKLLWSTYYGGELREAIYASACDAQGYLYIGGATESNYGIASTGFPGRYSPNYGASFVDGFVAKFSPAGVRQWGTHFGGEGQDWVSGIHAFRSGSIAITGTTTSNTNISTAGSHQSAKSDTLDAFIAKIGGSGNVIWSTYFGGDSLDISGGVTGDDTGSIFVCGATGSRFRISTPGSHQSIYGGNTDMYVAMFDASGGVVWSTYYGGADMEVGVSGAIYISGHIANSQLSFSRGRLWVCGSTGSATGISTPNSYQDTISTAPAQVMAPEAFVAAFDISGTRLWGSYFGGKGSDNARGIATDKLGNVYMVGETVSSAYLAANTPHRDTLYGFNDAYLVRIFDSVSVLRVRGIRPYCINDTFSLRHYITANGTMHPQNIFRAELSNVSGSFAAPTIIGTLAAPTGAGIPCKLPAGVTGSGYKVRIISSKPFRVSDTAGIQVSSVIPVPVITRSGGTLSTGTFVDYQWYKNGVAIAGATSASYKPTANGPYTVTVTSAGGCKGSSVVYNMTGVGIAGMSSLGDVNIYPNPTNDYLNIVGAAAGTQLVITNLVGQQVAATAIDAKRHTISLNGLPAGVYMLILSDSDGGKKIVQIVKQ